MKSTVLIADAARARFFRVLNPDDEDYSAGPRLREHDDLVNPEGQLVGAALYKNLKSGRKRAAGGGPAHGLDDHRARHEREIHKRFAKLVAATTAKHLEEQGTGRLVLVAPPRSLGVLRQEIEQCLPSTIRLEVLGSEMTWHALAHIESVLERRGLLAPRVLLDDTHRSPGQPRRS